MVNSGIFTADMAKASKTKDIPNFSIRLEMRGLSAEVIRGGLDAKMSNEFRKTYTSTIEAILLEYFKEKSIGSDKVSSS